MRIGPASGKSRMRMEPGYDEYDEMMMAEIRDTYSSEYLKHIEPPAAREKKRSAGGNSTNDAPNSIPTSPRTTNRQEDPAGWTARAAPAA